MLTAQVIDAGADGALRSPHFFNGRVLSAEDMALEQRAGQLQLHRLAQALGAGVAHGLEVRVASAGRWGKGAVLLVTPGLAFNRRGEAVALAAQTSLALVTDPPAAPSAGRDFRDVSLAPLAPLPEVYLLTAAPQARLDGRVPATSLGAEGRITGTGSGYRLEGVAFRLVPLHLPEGPGSADTLRNRLAHRCFGTAEAAAFPPAAARPYAGLEPLCPELTAADVPLALLCWAGGRIEWVDAWAVRRRLQPAVDPGWPLNLGPGRLAEVEAMLLQFQAHLADLQAQGGCEQVVAVRSFRYLPPLGYLPVGPGGFRPEVFFLGLPVAEQALDPGFLRLRLMEAWFAEPVDLGRPAPLLLYLPPGSEQALFLRREQAPAPPPVVVESTALILIEVTLPAERQPLDPGNLRVYAADARGRIYPAEAVGGLWRIRSLEPGVYTVWVLLAGCRAAGRRQAVRAGETVRLHFDLAPAAPEAGAPPPAECVTAGWAEAPGAGRLVLRGEPLRWAELPGAAPEWRLLPAAPTAVRDWLQAWAHWLLAGQPEAPVDPENIRLVADPSQGSAADPFAYVVFGEGGVYLPLRLAPAAPMVKALPGLLERNPAPVAEALRAEAEGEAALGSAPVPPRRRGGWWREVVSFLREFAGLPPQA